MTRVRAVLLALLAVVLVLPTFASAKQRGEGSPESESVKGASNVYVVRMLEQPVVAYEGGIAGLNATKPAKGKKLNPNDQDVIRYVGYLESRHSEVASKLGAGKVYDYAYAFNGFAAKLTPAQVAAARAEASVLSVEKTEEVLLDTATTPDFIGLKDSPAGLWTKGFKGEDVIVGILDTGIWPESKSFSDRDANGKLVYNPNPGLWHGRKCNPGEEWNASLCNQKLIGAQYFCESRSCDTGVLPHEFVSPRDYNGHGTHVGSTAGGNEGVATTQAAVLFGAVNGIAPRARVAAYKIGWDNGAGSAGANTGDVVAAIDTAVHDGVDVLNYSFSGTQTNYLDSVEIAFLFAGDAGVFVATSAGNSGPTASTVAHISPWLASVAAGTHDRSGSATVTLGNGVSYTGASLTDAASGNVVLATASGRAGGDPNLLRQCFSADAGGNALLDPAKIAGKIVVCERGGVAPANARVDKSVAVKNGGGIGMILYNVASSTLNADLHSIPTVHLDHVNGPQVVTYVNGAGASATASLSRATVTRTAPAPDVAAFSSRGPSTAGGGDILKPDFMLPGQDILAAVAPPGNAGKDFDIYSGTSMSSPHVAGTAALLSEVHPSWSPAAMRSAMATTADATSRAGLNLPFNVGSGHVRPNMMIDPGLVYDAGFTDYLMFLQGQNCGCLPAGFPAIDASDLNQPSLAVGDLAGAQTLERTVTNVGGSAATYNAVVGAPAGFSVTVAPSSFTIPSGGTQAFEVTITRTDGPLNTYRFGSLTWSDGTHSVRSPIVVRPVAIAAPAQLNLSGTSGAMSYTIKTGYAGALAYGKRGLIPSEKFSGTVADDPTSNFNTGNPAGNQGIATHDIVVPAGSALLRISMFDEETDGADDIDLYLYRVNADATLTIAGISGGGTSAEQIQITPAAAGATYRLFVHGWETDGPDANYSLHSWALGTSDAGNMTVTGPATATIGGAGTVDLSWSGLDAGKKYLGQIRYMDGATTHGTTIVRIDG